MKNRRILEVYETRNEENTIKNLFPEIEQGDLPEGIDLVVRSEKGFVDISKFEELPNDSKALLFNIEIPIVGNIIEICDLCVQKECVLGLITDTLTKYVDEAPEYKKYLGVSWGEKSNTYTRYPIEWVD